MNEIIATAMRETAAALRETAAAQEATAAEFVNVAAALEADSPSNPRWPWTKQFVMTTILRRIPPKLSKAQSLMAAVAEHSRWIAHLGVSGKR